MTIETHTLQTRQNDLQRRAGELTEIFNSSNRGHLPRWQPLAIEIFGADARDFTALTQKRDVVTEANIQRNFQQGLQLVESITLAAQRLYATVQLLAPIMTSDAQTYAANTQARVERLAEEKAFYTTNMKYAAGILANGDRLKFQEHLAALRAAENAKAPEITVQGSRLEIDMPALALAVTQLEPDLTLAYQTIADGIIDSVRTNFAYVAGLTLHDTRHAAEQWTIIGPQSDHLIKTANNYIRHAQCQIGLSTQETPWSSAMRAKMN